MRIVRHGHSGREVEFLQDRLMVHGFVPGTIDGIFGEQTELAVQQFQAAHALVVDGIVGDQTWSALLVDRRAPPPDLLVAREQQDLEAMIPLKAGLREREVLMAAIDTLGWAESPPGSNGGPQIDRISGGWYSMSDERIYGKPPWCALAISFWLRQGLGVQTYGETPFGRRIAAVAGLQRWAVHHDRWLDADTAAPAAPAAVFTMGRTGSGSDAGHNPNAGHCGLVVADEGEWLRTIEGNTNNRVASRRRRKTSLRGWFTWT
jgi:hypothetical protein